MAALKVIDGDHTMDLKRYSPEVRDILQKLDKRRAIALKHYLQTSKPADQERLFMYVTGILHCIRDVTNEWNLEAEEDREIEKASKERAESLTRLQSVSAEDRQSDEDNT